MKVKLIATTAAVLCSLPVTTFASILCNRGGVDMENTEVQQAAMKRTVTGKITDADTGEPIIGASIKIKGQKTGIISDVNGNYSINIDATKKNTTLQISYIGYQTQEIPVEDLGVINVKLQNGNTSLNEVVVVGAGTQKKISVTGAITSIKGDDLYSPTSSLTNMFAGKLAGVISNTVSGQPGQAASFYIRGISTFGGRATPLIMLDDVEISAADLNNIPPETIESFSILKDASATAIYGARGANGVMLITTKAGAENTRTVVHATVENAFNIVTNFPDFVDGPTYMEMYNQAQYARRPGETLQYTQEQIDNTRNNVNPYAYPNVNWKDVIFKDMALSQRANLNISGGGSKATYYMSIQANHDAGVLNTKKVYSYDNNINNWSYNFQNNINYKLTSSTKLELRMNAQIRNWQRPNYNPKDLFGLLYTVNPVAFPITYPAMEGDTHIRFGNAIKTGQTLYTNPYAYMLSSYNQTQENTINTSLKVMQNFDFITKGLSATLLINFKNWSTNGYSRSINPYYYRIKPGTYNAETGEYEMELLQTGTDYIAQSDISKDGDNTFVLQATIDYARRFGKHNVTGMLLYMQREYKSNVLPNRNQGLSGRFTYDYDQRYLAEVNFGYNGTERLAKHHRFEFFPAVSLGWVISNEKFMEPLRNVISSFKLRGSYGLVGSDETGLTAGAPHFLYIDQVNVSGAGRPGYTFGEALTNTKYGPLMTQYAVANAGWERVKKLDIGFDAEFFRELSVTFDFFYDKRYNILLHREAWPESLGYYTAKPWSNKGKVDNWGYELSTTWRHAVNKDLRFELRGNFTYTQNKYVDLDEPIYPYPWQTSTGKPLSRMVGYIAEGLFTSQEEIDNSPRQDLGSTTMVGDIKYRDINGDGVINTYDQAMISPYGSIPRIQYGVGLNIDYKRFNFGVFFNGSAMRKKMISGITPFGQYNNNVMQFIADDYWSTDNQNPDAAYPRLGINSTDVANNTVSSTYWMRNGNFIRFKTLEIGYSFPHIRIYFTGNNLFVFSPFKLWDPELDWNSYPLQRTFNIGAQLTF